VPFSQQDENRSSFSIWTPNAQGLKTKGDNDDGFHPPRRVVAAHPGTAYLIRVCILGYSIQGRSAIEVTDVTNLVESHGVKVVRQNRSITGASNSTGYRRGLPVLAGFANQRLTLG
jgi:hypothetical protein